jgi:hypothetical protein
MKAMNTIFKNIYSTDTLSHTLLSNTEAAQRWLGGRPLPHNWQIGTRWRSIAPLACPPPFHADAVWQAQWSGKEAASEVLLLQRGEATEGATSISLHMGAHTSAHGIYLHMGYQTDCWVFGFCAKTVEQ